MRWQNETELKLNRAQCGYCRKGSSEHCIYIKVDLTSVHSIGNAAHWCHWFTPSSHSRSWTACWIVCFPFEKVWGKSCKWLWILQSNSLPLESSCALRQAAGPQLGVCLGSCPCWGLCLGISSRSKQLTADGSECIPTPCLVSSVPCCPARAAGETDMQWQIMVARLNTWGLYFTTTTTTKNGWEPIAKIHFNLLN